MGERDHQWGSFAPIMAPPLDNQRDFDDTSSHWRRFDSSVNAVSFGFVATAVLISMFLVMAIFERFLRPASPETSSEGPPYRADVEAPMGFYGKHRFPSPKVPTNPREVSVLMPGDNIPSFIAQPAPVPCAPERVSWADHHHITRVSTAQNPSSRTSSSSICEH